jgi:hypothetical protein
MAFKLMAPWNNRIHKGNKYENWIPNFNKLDITIDVGTIKNTFTKYACICTKSIRGSGKDEAKVVPHRDSCQIEQKEVHFLY